MSGAWSLCVLLRLAEPAGVDAAGPGPGIDFAEPVDDAEEPESADEPTEDGAASSTEFIEQPGSGPEPSRGSRRRVQRLPPIYGPVLFSAGVIAGPNAGGLTAGLTRFVIPYVGFGLDIHEVVVFDSRVFNDFAVTAHVRLMALPYRRVSPYLQLGFGGEFFSAKLGAYGLGKAGTGVVFRLGKKQRFNLRLGAQLQALFPDAKFKQRFHCMLTDKPCSLVLFPEIGFGMRFGQR